MKKLIILTFCALILNAVAVAQKKELSVKEHFLALPTEFIKAEAKKRAAWIESESLETGYLSYSIPLSELTDEEGDADVFGAMQIFEKKGGGTLIGMINNLCAEGQCIGMMRFLDYKNGKYTDVSDDYLIVPDNDEVIKILRAAPAFEKKSSLKDGEQVPLALDFNSNDKVIHFIAGCEDKSCGGVVAKMYKWNGEAFVEFEYEESPE